MKFTIYPSIPPHRVKTLSEMTSVITLLARRYVFFSVIALVCFAFLPTTRAVDPPPDGGYPNKNTAEGDNALLSLTSGADNTALGYNALFTNNTGANNTATGSFALTVNGTGSNNTATGSYALYSNTTGVGNTATGYQALYSNIDQYFNTAIGYQALLNNVAGTNTAIGASAMLNNTTGRLNTAVGLNALGSNQAAHENTALGVEALYNTTGSNNIALGYSAGSNLTTGGNNIVIGANVLGKAGDANKIRIGKQGVQNGTFIAGISGVAVTGSQVLVNSSGKLGVMSSSARFKEAIKPMDKASETVLKLEPVTFRYKDEIDPDGAPQFGLIAEQVEKVNSDLVIRDEGGKPYTVRYEAVNAMLLNEFLKEHRKVEEQGQKLQKQEATIARQQKSFESKLAQQRTVLEKQIEALSAGLQKVSDKIELAKPAPQVVANDR